MRQAVAHARRSIHHTRGDSDPRKRGHHVFSRENTPHHSSPLQALEDARAVAHVPTRPKLFPLITRVERASLKLVHVGYITLTSIDTRSRLTSTALPATCRCRRPREPVPEGTVRADPRRSPRQGRVPQHSPLQRARVGSTCRTSKSTVPGRGGPMSARNPTGNTQLTTRRTPRSMAPHTTGPSPPPVATHPTRATRHYLISTFETHSVSTLTIGAESAQRPR